MRGFYQEGQFSNVPEGVSDILVWGYNKTYSENGIDFKFVHPVKSRTKMLYAMSDNQMIAYIFPTKFCGHSASQTRKIYKVVLTEQYISELSDIFNNELNNDDLLSVVANVFSRSTNVVKSESSIISRMNKKTDVNSVFSYDEFDDIMTFLSAYTISKKKKMPKIIGEIPEEVVNILCSGALPHYEDFRFMTVHKTKILYKKNDCGISCYVYDNVNRLKKYKVTNNFINSLLRAESIKDDDILNWITRHQLWAKKEDKQNKLHSKDFSVYVRETKKSERLFLGVYIH